MKKIIAGAVVSAALLLHPLPLAANELLDEFEKKTTVHVLDNGWTFIIVERPVAAVFSFATVVDVGGAQEVPGITGLAHMFEHMAFKGTPVLGTKDYEAEKKALEEVEAAYQAYEARRRDPRASEEEIAALEATFREKQEKAAEYVVANEFDELVDRNGGVGMNAGTGSDSTSYFYSLPANRLELFAYLESERFLRPVFREFYKERDVVKEERRLRTESQPFGRLIEQIITTAFLAHPYKQPVVGYMSDLDSFTATDAKEFYKTHYVPANMVTSIVGHVKTAEVIALVEKYFGRIPKGPKPPPLRTVEPEQIAEKTVILRESSQPIYLEAYHRPSVLHEDDPVYDAISDILSNGRTSRLYRSLVRDKKIAQFANAFMGFPGNKYPTLALFFSFPARGHSNEEVQAAIRHELERLKTEEVSDLEMERFRTRAKANLIRGMSSNVGIANRFATHQTLFGDWREVFRIIDRFDDVTKADILRVAQTTFKASNRTVAMLVNTDDAKPGAEPAGTSGH